MNRQRYRLVFSRHLGTLVAVAECARAQGKAASGTRGAVALAGALLLATPGWAQNLPVPSAGGGIPNFVTAGQAAYQAIGQQAFVNQVGNKAILNWQNFNVGAGHSVQFRQVHDLNSNQLVQGASFTTLNRIWDINPSVIAGAISQGAGQKANVILVNSNGIAFMGGSQVNLNSLTATTLNMADRFVMDRLLGDPTTPQFANALDGGEARGFIKVFEGANITATDQGRVMLIAPTVINRGQIQAPDGQIILAAGTKAYLRSDDDNNNLNLRGLLVEVDSSSGLSAFDTANTSVGDGVLDGQTVALANAADDKLGHATNHGHLVAERGNVTMVGFAVNQNGLARATSSVVANGSVYLMAKDTYVPPATAGATPYSSRFGQVIMGSGSGSGSGSRTEVLPDESDTLTTPDGNSGSGQAQASEVRALGLKVYMADGATIKAPSGEVSLTATDTPTPVLGGTVAISTDKSPSTSEARVHVAAGAVIDVAGIRGVKVSAARNSVEVELRGDELKDSPVNQSGPLRGEKAWMDVQQALDNAAAGKDTLIAKDSLDAYAALLERGINERSTTGGRVVLDSAGSVIVEDGATIDLSGGSVDYQEALVKTTVLSSRGKMVDLADASASTRYDGIVSRYRVDYDRWNKSEVIELPGASRLAGGYTEGKNAGSLYVFSRGASYLRPNVVGSTVTGERQQAASLQPRGAQVYIGQSGTGLDALEGNSLTQKVVIDRALPRLPGGLGLNEALPDALKETLSIDADLLAAGRVAELSVLTSQAAEVRTALRAPLGGKVDIGARDIQVKADIVAAGGHIGLHARNLDPVTPSDTRVVVDGGVTLSTAGNWVNRTPGLQDRLAVSVLSGGSITIEAESDVDGGAYVGQGSVALGKGVTIDANGGALRDADGRFKAGAGGSIDIEARGLQGLEDAQLTAYGVEEGGSLRVATRDITIGGAKPQTPVAGELHLDPDFLTRGGFAHYDLQAQERLQVADNTVLRPVVAQRVLNDDAASQASSDSLASVSTVQVLDPLKRQATSIALTARENATDSGDLRIGTGARIEVDPGASIDLSARKRLAIEGSLVAQGGDVSATLTGRPTGGFSDANLPQGNLFLGDQAVIDVSGVARTYTDDQGQTQGKLLAGGSVTLRAEAGALVTRAGSVINVSGAAPVVLGEPNERGGVGREVASAAGSVSLRSNNLFLDGQLRAQGGAADQRGGSLVIGSAADGSLPESATVLSNTVLNLELHNALAPQAAGLDSQTEVAGSSMKVATQSLESSGFEQLGFVSSDGVALSDGLQLGSANLRELKIDAARIEARGNASLAADAVRLGNYHEGVRVGSAGSALNNGGVLSATGRLVELAGDLRLQGMDRSELNGSEIVQLAGVTHQAVGWANGAPQVSGPFKHSARIESAGDLTLRGGVVAPGGYADVSLQAAGREVRIESNGSTPVVPLSALGQLSIEAREINQAGYLVAPFGQIRLDATDSLTLEEGSVTSVAGTPGQVLPAGQLLNGVSWQINLKPDDLDNGQTTFDTLPNKELRLSGAQVALQAGAVVDVSGGGDLQAYEFTAGPGGSKDILNDARTFAILPGYQSGFAPDDAQESTGLGVGESIFLSGVKGLADGKYVLLPAHYALLPGAMAVRLGGDTAPVPGGNFTRQDGIQVVAGYLSDSRANATRAGDWQGVQVLSQDQVRARSEFTVARASGFFDGRGELPRDAGLLSLSTQGQIQLDAEIRGQAAAQGRGLALDVVAPELLIAGSDATAAAGTTLLDVDKLNALQARSMLLGATREADGDATVVTVGANKLTLQNNAGQALKASEVMLAAKDSVTLAAGSAIDAQGADGDSGHYTTAGNGAFVRAASTSASFARTGAPDRSSGTLIGAGGEGGAVIQAAKSITLDATRDNQYAGLTRFRANGKDVAGELAVGASRISFGNPAAPVEGITLTPDALALLQGLDGLTLTSYSSLDFYDGVTVGALDASGKPLLRNLTLQGGGLVGLDNAGSTASLNAQNLTLRNPAAADATLPAGQTGVGSGKLAIRAERLTLGEGSKTIDGFSEIDIRSREIVADGSGTTTLKGSTTIATDRLSGTTAAAQTLDAGNTALTLKRMNEPGTLAEATGLGANWTVKAGSINFDTRAQLHSGSVSLQAATGDVALGENADIDVSGRAVTFFNVTRGTWGGEVNLQATNGNVVVTDNPASAARARIDVSGAAGADGGTLTVQAVEGNADLSAATLVGQAAADTEGHQGEGARVRVDANQVTGFSAFNSALNAGGFAGERNVRTRSGGLTVAAADVVKAQTVKLSADGGELRVDGTVSASGDDGGLVSLTGQSVTLADAARVEARAESANGEGGRVEIGAATRATEAASGDIDLQAGATIDVSGGSGGEVRLRAQRQGTGVAATLRATLIGARDATLEAVRVYDGKTMLDGSGTNAGGTLGLAHVIEENNTYATAYSGPTQAGLRVVAGVEVRSAGDMTLAADWNLNDAGAFGDAGVLTLRAGGNLNLNNNLSDGFKTSTPAYLQLTNDPEAANPLLADTVRGGRSWSYNLVGGADLGSADVMATIANANGGDVKLAAGKLVRTGTGDIQVAAGRNVELGSNTSVIYTAGKRAADLSDYTNPSSVPTIRDPRAYFTEGGGDVRIEARNDVIGKRSSQLYSEWLWRVGRLASDGQSYATDTVGGQSNQGQTAWWVRFDQFQQGVGTLGGGTVSVSAGRDVKDLSLSAPTQGRMNSTVVDASKLVKTGGGDVRVQAGRDVLGGQYFADEGDVRLVAGRAMGSGELAPSSNLALYPVLAVGNGQVQARSHGDLNVQAIINPQLVVQSSSTVLNAIANLTGPNTSSSTPGSARRTLFSTYGSDTGAELSSLTGDVVFHSAEGVANESARLAQVYTGLYANPIIGASTIDVTSLLNLLPSSLAMTAYAGDVKLPSGKAPLTLLPSATGQLELLAQGSVELAGDGTGIIISDRDPASIPSAARPIGYLADQAEAFTPSSGRVNASVPVHSGDTTPARIFAVDGDVVWQGSTTDIALDSSKAVEVRAGGDLKDINLRIQHANASDRSVVQAGRDLSYSPGAQRTESAGIRVSGLGVLEVTAGRDLDLGTSGGIVSRGDLDNPNLPVGGASIQVMAGVGAKGLDAAGTLERLAARVAGGSVSDSDLWLVRWLVGNDSLGAGDAAAAVANVRAQDQQSQRDQVREMVFTALRATGRASNQVDSGYANDFSRGYAALELVFPGIGKQDANGRFSEYQGSINLFASRIKTERGGDIELMVPGGGMVVGLANTPENLTRTDGAGSLGALGVVTTSTGDIKGFARDDVLVNQSRMLTVGGGDILLWSSEGDLDAGKGKKTAASVPPPIIRTDPQGNVVQELQGAATGSGIGALKTGANTAGDVDLIAPRGTVNAGDAGIRAGNLNIAAQVVLGADNISVSGTSTGTPVADTSAVTAASSGATSGGNDAADVVESLNQAAAESARAAQELASSLRPSVVRVEVLGYGE